MARTAKFDKAIIETAKASLAAAKTIREFRSAQAILLPALSGLTREQTAAAIGLSTSRVGGLQAEARNPGPSAKAPHGGRRRQIMSFEEEAGFLRPWTEKAAGAGMVIVPPLHEALEKHLGRKVHHSVVYRMLARHGWRKLPPDSVHPKAIMERQEDWEKTPGSGGRKPEKPAGTRKKATVHVPGRGVVWQGVAPPAPLVAARRRWSPPGACATNWAWRRSGACTSAPRQIAVPTPTNIDNPTMTVYPIRRTPQRALSPPITLQSRPLGRSNVEQE